VISQSKLITSKKTKIFEITVRNILASKGSMSIEAEQRTIMGGVGFRNFTIEKINS